MDCFDSVVVLGYYSIGFFVVEAVVSGHQADCCCLSGCFSDLEIDFLFREGLDCDHHVDYPCLAVVGYHPICSAAGLHLDPIDLVDSIVDLGSTVGPYSIVLDPDRPIDLLVAVDDVVDHPTVSEDVVHPTVPVVVGPIGLPD